MNAIKIEICSNTEWLRDNANLDLSLIDEADHDEAADELNAALHRHLERAGYETCGARGQRVLYHGWNGANTFRHKLGPVGTFDQCSEQQLDEIWAAIEAAINEVQTTYSPVSE